MDYKVHVTTSWPTLRKMMMLKEKPWLTDGERSRLRLTGRSVYGRYPYVKTEEEGREWREAGRVEKPEEETGEIPEEEEVEREEGEGEKPEEEE
ncbi:hypothetical protein AKJ46_00185 [candidate division MSBL1 archaeon SCGC-AAA833K04]|uniref:Uncharacterized protein n=1 Tax=candidate division MSBL1 archaeon SCGC-AAA833K04 TaxID=1698258 RepID=A0A133VST9_9EURY|nr:hypothetical protein AKJ46_00185 [candidate division MSBL1 archaeon SCGC-AAA833K04]